MEVVISRIAILTHRKERRVRLQRNVILALTGIQQNNIFISKGNRKLVGNIFNLPVGVTCKTDIKCLKYCYALKAERMYKGVLPSRHRNLEASKTDKFVDTVTLMLQKSKLRITRIHESGDFYSVEYILKWYKIAENIPDMKFYAYTKRDDLFTVDILSKRPSNFSILWSIDGILDDNEDISKIVAEKIFEGYDKIAVIRKTKANCPEQLSDKVTCMMQCKKCLRDNAVHTKVIEFSYH